MGWGGFSVTPFVGRGSSLSVIYTWNKHFNSVWEIAKITKASKFLLSTWLKWLEFLIYFLQPFIQFSKHYLKFISKYGSTKIFGTFYHRLIYWDVLVDIAIKIFQSNKFLWAIMAKGIKQELTYFHQLNLMLRI